MLDLERTTNISIDEFNIVFQLEKDINYQSIKNIFDKIIEEVDLTLSLSLILGKIALSKKSLKGMGYTTTYQFGISPVYIMFNQEHPRMGVSLKFSASGYSLYRDIIKKYDKWNDMPIDLFQIIQKLESNDKINNLGSWRLSRCDIAIDYFNYDMSPDDVYHKINNGEITIKDSRGRKNKSSTTAIVKENIVETFYIGKRSSPIFARYYDKKKEQIYNSKPYYTIAQNVSTWFRFEVEFKNKEAHKITNSLKTMTIKEYEKFLYSQISKRYRLFNDKTNKYEPITEIIINKSLKLVDEKNKYKNSLDNKKDDLSKSKNYFISGSSGLQTLLYKIYLKEGDEGINLFLSQILDYQKNFFRKNPSKDATIYSKRQENKKNLDATMTILTHLNHLSEKGEK